MSGRRTRLPCSGGLRPGRLAEIETRGEPQPNQLARLIGATAPFISRLEDADYEGHSLAMLRRIAGALNR